MQKIIVSLMTCFVIALFLGCQPTLSREYLLQHPNQLQKEYERCQLSNTNTTYCDDVLQAVQEFTKLMNMHRINQQTFGQTILDAEMQMVKDREILNEAEKASQSNPSADMQKKLNVAKDAYQVQSNYVQTLLAVVSAATTPNL